MACDVQIMRRQMSSGSFSSRALYSLKAFRDALLAGSRPPWKLKLAACNGFLMVTSTQRIEIVHRILRDWWS